MDSINLRVKKLEQLSGVQRIIVAYNKAEIEAMAKQYGIDLEGGSII